jgi:hypothetical protein
MTGNTGIGIPTGGYTGEVLTKNSTTDYDVSWQPSAGGTGGGGGGYTGPTGPTGPTGVGVTGPTGSGGSAYIPVNQTAHGFTSGQAVYFNGTTWFLAQANNINTLGIGIVSYVDANDFNLYQSGAISGLTGLTAGQYYFVSDVTAGLITSTPPTSTSSFSNPILFALTTTTGIVLPFRPSEILYPTNYAPESDSLLDNEPMSPNVTYQTTWNGAYISNEAWYVTGPTLLKNIAYIFVGGFVTQEVRKVFYSDGITVVAQSTISYTYSNNVLSVSSYVRNI